MDEDWGPHYTSSAEFGATWLTIRTPGAAWPQGHQLHRDKLYLHGKLCVPETLVHRVLREFHVTSGHLGAHKVVAQLYHRLHLPPGTRSKLILETLRTHCTTCQARTPPTNLKDGQREPFPIPERLMHSVSLDIFKMPETQWAGKDFDAILLCVDRLSGWLIACPTRSRGLTAEQAAHLLLDGGWGPFGLPATVHSDKGAQFVGQWFQTMCARLGIHQTTSQAHRPRANGRAEKAGQQLLDVLAKLHVDQHVNWVEALPRALIIHHDTVGEGDLSPYNIMFGRDRNIPGIPYTPERTCEDALHFFERMSQVDKLVSEALTRRHASDTARTNRTKPAREAFSPGDLVWLYRAPSLASSTKLEPRWSGPFAVTARWGEHSYLVADKLGKTTPVHVDQLKPYYALGEAGELAGLAAWDRKILCFRGSRKEPDGEVLYLVQWEDGKDCTWLPYDIIVAMGAEPVLVDYLQSAPL